MYGASCATSPNSRSTVRIRACASLLAGACVDRSRSAPAGTARCVDPLDEAHAREPLQRDLHAALREPHHLGDASDRADRVQVVGRRVAFERRVVQRRRREQPVAADDVLDERDRRLASDEDGQREVREQHRVAQRQDADDVGIACGRACARPDGSSADGTRRLSTTRGPGAARFGRSLGRDVDLDARRTLRHLRQRDREHPVRELGGGAARVDRRGRTQPALELAERDLELQALGPRGLGRTRGRAASR